MAAAMGDATVRLLEAAAEIVGGEAALAKHLHIGEALLRAYLEARQPLPDFLLLRTVDLVLDDINRPQPVSPRSAQAVQDTVSALKSRSG